MLICHPGISITVDESGATLHLDLPKTQETFALITELYQGLYPWLPAQFQVQDLGRIHRSREVIWAHDQEVYNNSRIGYN